MDLHEFIEKCFGGNISAMGRFIERDRTYVQQMLKSHYKFEVIQDGDELKFVQCKFKTTIPEGFKDGNS